MEPDAAPNAAPPKTRRRWYQFSLRSLLLVVTILPTLVWAFDRLGGGAIEDAWLDVEMRYQVVNASTGRVLPGATVDFVEYVVKPGRVESVVTMSKTTDADGIAARVCKNSGCSWHASGFGWTTRFFAGGDIPWAVRFSAPGYQPTDIFMPNSREYEWRSEYLGNGKARATIRVPLERSADRTADS